MPKITKKRRKMYIQLAEYLVSGGAYFWSGYLLFYLLDQKIGATFAVAKLSASVFGWTINFILQRYWVFRNPHLKGHFGQVSWRYIMISLIDFGLDFLIVLGLKNFGITPYLGQFASAGFFTVWNYLWYKYWVFPQRLPSPKHPGRRHIRPHHLKA
jgi:putative flippase GtrA